MVSGQPLWRFRVLADVALAILGVDLWRILHGFGVPGLQEGKQEQIDLLSKQG